MLIPNFYDGEFRRDDVYLERPKSSQSLCGFHILVIGSRLANRRIGRELCGHGAHVYSCTDVSQAICLIEADTPDLIVFDCGIGREGLLAFIRRGLAIPTIAVGTPEQRRLYAAGLKGVAHKFVFRNFLERGLVPLAEQILSAG